MNYNEWNYTIAEPGPVGFGKTVLNEMLLGYGGILLLIGLFLIIVIAYWYKTREILGSLGLASVVVFVASVGMLVIGWVTDTTVWFTGIIAAILGFMSVLIPKS